MAEKQKIPVNAHECDIYKPARNFLMVRNSISGLRSTCRCTFVLRFIKSTKGVWIHFHFVIFIVLDIRVFHFFYMKGLKNDSAFTLRFSIRCVLKLKFYFILFFCLKTFFI